MTYQELKRLRATLLQGLNETRIRIRRYSLDPMLHVGRRNGKPATEEDREHAEELRRQADEAWQEWLELRAAFLQLPETPSAEQLLDVERQWLELDRKVDLIQRELISDSSFRAGFCTLGWIVPALVVLVLLYLLIHGVRGFDMMSFEPLPEWGPLKYVEVAFWSGFGILCTLAFTASYYMSRRDFDVWYQPWYISTALRAPFLTVILMMIVLEFAEWYGQDGGWVETYILEEGNKYYFIIFMSFVLGLTSDTSSAIFRDLSEGVTGLVQRAVSGVVRRLNGVMTVVEVNEK